MKIKKLLSAAILSLVATYSFAQAIELYDQPKNDAKVVGKIDASTGIMPIFTPKDGGWVKVADPTNGNVGWVKQSDLNKVSNSSVSFTQQFIKDGKASAVQLFQFGQPQKSLTPQQKAWLEQLQKNQQIIEQKLQGASQQMLREMQSIFQWNSAPNTAPLMPIIILPVQTNQPAAKQPVKTPTPPPVEQKK